MRAMRSQSVRVLTFLGRCWLGVGTVARGRDLVSVSREAVREGDGDVTEFRYEIGLSVIVHKNRGLIAVDELEFGDLAAVAPAAIDHRCQRRHLEENLRKIIEECRALRRLDVTVVPAIGRTEGKRPGAAPGVFDGAGVLAGVADGEGAEEPLQRSR